MNENIADKLIPKIVLAKKKYEKEFGNLPAVVWINFLDCSDIVSDMEQRTHMKMTTAQIFQMEVYRSRNMPRGEFCITSKEFFDKAIGINQQWKLENGQEDNS